MNAVFGRNIIIASVAKIFAATAGLFLLNFAAHAQADVVRSPTQVEIARGFADALNSQNVDSITNFIDFKAFGKLVTSKLETDRKIKRAILEQYQTTNFARTFTNSAFILPPGTIGTYGYKYVLSTKEFGDRPFLRIDFEGGGHEFILLFINESNKIEDLFYATKGNRVSATVAGTTQLILPAQNAFIKRLSGGNGNSGELIKKFTQMLALRQEGRFTEVHDILQTFPDKLLSTRELVDFNVLISQNVSDEAYVEALAKLDKYFGDDESTSFMLVDFHVTKEDYPAAMKSTNKAMEFWGQDAALVHLKATLSFLMDDDTMAIKYAKEAIAIEPNFEDPYWTLISLQDEAADVNGVNNTLSLMQKQFDETFTPDRLNEYFELPNYEASDVYKAALERKRFLP